jgi:prepilin-type N-terminal cleavage/methylation domain-containing protein
MPSTPNCSVEISENFGEIKHIDTFSISFIICRIANRNICTLYLYFDSNALLLERKQTVSKTDHRQLTTAFTLVELLVVIAIIGVLVASLLPAASPLFAQSENN